MMNYLPSSIFLWSKLIYKRLQHGRELFIFHVSSMFCGISRLPVLLVMPTLTDCNAFYNSKIGQVTVLEMPSIPP